MKKGYVLLLLLFCLGCEKQTQTPISVLPTSAVESLSLSYKLVLNYPKDANGRYEVPLLDTGYTRFNMYVEANELPAKYEYGGTSAISAQFDSSSFWIMGNNLSVTLPLYNPFNSLYSNPYYNTPLPSGSKTVTLSQFQGYIVPIVQDTKIYFKEYKGPTNSFIGDEYIPSNSTNNYWSKRIIGPVPYTMKGKSTTIYAKIFWDAGNYSYLNPSKTTKLDSIKVIFK